MRRVAPSRPSVPEKRVQADIVHLLRTVGATVYVLGGHRRTGDYHGTMQTPGLPDVIAFIPIRHGDGRTKIMLCVEVKAAGGRLRPEQVAFAQACWEADVFHVTGNLDTVVQWLEDAPLTHRIRTEQR